MKINFRTVKQQKFEIEIDENETVKSLKNLIHQRENIDPSTLILIFSGKFMEDDKQIKEYNIKEKDFVVITVKQPPRANAQKVDAPNKNTQNQPQTNNQNTNIPPQTIDPNANEGLIKELTQMGFPREEAIHALNIAINDLNAAVEYLTNGYPQDDDDDDNYDDDMDDYLDDEYGDDDDGFDTGMAIEIPEGGNIFDVLRKDPLFVKMRALVQSNPNYLQDVLNNLSQSDPNLYQYLQEHQQEFAAFINEPVSQEQLQQAMAEGLGLTGESLHPTTVQITPEENEVINNLVSMGFNKDKVIEMFLLFEKDPVMTANYFLNNGNMDD